MKPKAIGHRRASRAPTNSVEEKMASEASSKSSKSLEAVVGVPKNPPLKRDLLTGRIIGCAYKVAYRLGAGFLEKVYENALSFELQNAGFAVEQQKAVSVYYQGRLAGEYYADLLVDSKVLIELKACQDIEEAHLAQCLNYLRATGLRTCLLINFGQAKLKIKRISARAEWGQNATVRD